MSLSKDAEKKKTDQRQGSFSGQVSRQKKELRGSP
jgi:hypothetical protein